MAHGLGYRVAVSEPDGHRNDELLPPAAVDFIARLDNLVAGTRRALLDERRQRRDELTSGQRRLDFLPETATVRSGAWQVAGARSVPSATVDLGDTLAPTWGNVRDAHESVVDAAQRRTPTQVRPRGWHLVEKHVRVDGRPVSATVFDVALALWHTAGLLVDAGASPVISVTKLESHREARLVEQLLAAAEDQLELPPGAVRVMVSVDTVTAAFETDEILYELRHRVLGLAAGHDDYLASVIKNAPRGDADAVLPDRAAVTSAAPFLRAYATYLARTAARRSALLVGDPDDGGAEVTADGLGTVATTGGDVTLDGVRRNVSVAVGYLASWLDGSGPMRLAGTTVDAATADLARCQLWQWIDTSTKLADGTVVTRELVTGLLDEEVAAAGGARSVDARTVLVEAALGETLPSYVTTSAYARYLTTGR